MKRNTLLIALIALAVMSVPLVIHAQILPEILPSNCDPAQPPSDGGCGIPAFVQLLKNIINYLTIIVIPLAIGVTIWGGIVMMTAGGSEERARKGKSIIKTAIIGIAIALGAWLIINSIFLALTGTGVQEAIQ